MQLVCVKQRNKNKVCLKYSNLNLIEMYKHLVLVLLLLVVLFPYYRPGFHQHSKQQCT